MGLDLHWLYDFLTACKACLSWFEVCSPSTLCLLASSTSYIKLVQVSVPLRRTFWGKELGLIYLPSIVPRRVTVTSEWLRKLDKWIHIILEKQQVWETEVGKNKPQCCPLCKVIQSGFCQIPSQNFLMQFDRFGHMNQWIVLDLSGHSLTASDKVNLTKAEFLFLWCGKYTLGWKGPISIRVYGK